MTLRNHRHPVRSLEQAANAIVAACGDHYVKIAEDGAKHYRREDHLRRILPLWEHEYVDYSSRGIRNIIEKLMANLISARNAARHDRWFADTNYQIALSSALIGELALLEQAEREAA